MPRTGGRASTGWLSCTPVVEPVETRGWSSVERVVELVETTGQVVELVEANPLSTRHSGPRKLSVATSSLMGMEPVADDLERQAVADALVQSTPPW